MKTVVSVLVGIVKIIFVGFVLAWTKIMNLIGYLICLIGSQK